MSYQNIKNKLNFQRKQHKQKFNIKDTIQSVFNHSNEGTDSAIDRNHEVDDFISELTGSVMNTGATPTANITRRGSIVSKRGSNQFMQIVEDLTESKDSIVVDDFETE